MDTAQPSTKPGELLSAECCVSCQTYWLPGMLSWDVLHALLYLLQLEKADCWEDAIDEVIQHFELEHQRRATYTICYY